MFKKVKLFNLGSVAHVKPNNYKDQFKKFDNEIPSESLRMLNSDFLVNGTIQFLFPMPISPHTKDNFLYIQAFMILNCHNESYTKRTNYDSYLLLYTYDGEGTLEYDGNKYTLSTGDGFLIDCKKPHFYYSKSEKWNHCNLYFNGRTAPILYNEFTKNYTNKFSTSKNGKFPVLLENLLYYYTTLSNYREVYVSNRLESLLVFLLYEAEQKNIISLPENIEKLIKYMKNNFSSALTLDTLATFSKVSKYHLCREFKKYTGFSPNEYLIELRIAEAKLLLENTKLPIYKISIIVGIENETNFLRLFKKRTGITPSDYRKSSCFPY